MKKVFFGLALQLACPSPLAALDAWSLEKCSIYAKAWRSYDAGLPDLSTGFRASNETFIAAGCQARTSACPSNDADHEVADQLNWIMVIEGAPGSFLPFSCRRHSLAAH
ncbi:hypothetical protein [Leisingera methylohalidivorans]|uniref:Uncharacterized protein n=1 Tax=Leisingera methylohalidivorans DSM 14336 TaxID=999552 RepID=V9W1J2_9RHOB|nr:hypothetical protein [Leisingera methylohalidivorans]AHD03540.1 hypothetical protein METH_22185 [Leisingera methylohalidivorans DSM 14336]